MSPRRPGSPGAGRLLPAQASPPSPAGLRSASRGAAQAQETLRTCPGSQDSGGAGEGSQGTGLWRPATIEGGPQAPSPCSGPRRGGWSDSTPCPSSPAGARRSTRTYTPLGRPRRRRLRRSAHFLSPPPAGRRHILHLQGTRDQPRTLLPSGRCGVAAAAPGTCAWARVVGTFASRWRRGACPPHLAAAVGTEGRSAHDFLKSP